MGNLHTHDWRRRDVLMRCSMCGLVGDTTDKVYGPDQTCPAAVAQKKAARRFWIVLRPDDVRGHYVAEDEELVEFDRNEGREVVEVVEVSA